MTWSMPWFFAAVPAVLALGLIVTWATIRHTRRLQSVFPGAYLDRVLPKSVRVRRWIRHGLTLCGLMLMVLALAEPLMGKQLREVEAKGVDVVMVVDLSRSMDCTDAPPSRLEHARREMIDMLGLFEGDRVGLVIYAAGAYPRMPLSHDYRAMEMLVSELETFMEEAAPVCGAPDPGPAYWHGNQHDMHAIYLFNEAGRPDLTQKWVRWALTDRYGTGPDGLDGNDDGGTLSAWYVLSAIGLYPIAGTDRYWVGAPIVDRADVSLGDGVTLTVIAENQGPENIYVQEASVNRERLCSPFLRHARIAQGGTLAFEMGPTSAPGGGFECP